MKKTIVSRLMLISLFVILGAALSSCDDNEPQQDSTQKDEALDEEEYNRIKGYILNEFDEIWFSPSDDSKNIRLFAAQNEEQSHALCEGVINKEWDGNDVTISYGEYGSVSVTPSIENGVYDEISFNLKEIQPFTLFIASQEYCAKENSTSSATVDVVWWECETCLERYKNNPPEAACRICGRHKDFTRYRRVMGTEVLNDPFNGHEAVLMRKAGNGVEALYIGTTNVGAGNKTEIGKYFWWGDIVGAYSNSGFDFSENNPAIKTYNKSAWDLVEPGYFTSREDMNNLRSRFDAASFNWGGKWRMPTWKDWSWLKFNCSWTWTENYESSGVKGYIVKSNETEGEIFLPAAGYCKGSELIYPQVLGKYWSRGSFRAGYDAGDGYKTSDILRFTPSTAYPDYSEYRCMGLSVRPVSN
jgi:non-specific serine/threonine protein kinase